MAERPLPTSDEFLERVRLALRPQEDEFDEIHRLAELDLLRSDEWVRDFATALTELSIDLDHQFAIRKDDDSLTEDEYEDWRKRASGFRHHLGRYLRDAKERVKRLNIAESAASSAAYQEQEAVRLRAAIQAHRDAIHADNADADWTPADEELWACVGLDDRESR